MKIKDLLLLIETSKKDYPDIEEWAIALEQHPDYESCSNCNKPEDSFIYEDEFLPERDGTPSKVLFIKSHCMGCCTWFVKDKTLGIQIHY
jgi:hypothetical protein